MHYALPCEESKSRTRRDKHKWLQDSMAMCQGWEYLSGYFTGEGDKNHFFFFLAIISTSKNDPHQNSKSRQTGRLQRTRRKKERGDYFAGVYVGKNCTPTTIAVAQLHNWGTKQNKLRPLWSHHLPPSPSPSLQRKLCPCSLAQDEADEEKGFSARTPHKCRMEMEENRLPL